MDTTLGITTPPLSSADVEARITAERHRLLTEQNLEQDLTGQRLAPLEAGDDEALDRVETQINGCRERQLRAQERIELLAQRLEVAREREQNTELDRVARIGERARAMGERLIVENYAEQAQALASTLGRLAAIDALIEKINLTLRAGCREIVPAPNLVRSHPAREWDEKVIKRVGIGEWQHPYHGKAQRSADSDTAYVNGTGEPVPAFMDVEVVEHRIERRERYNELTDEVILPGVGPAPRGQGLVSIWDNGARLAARERATTVLAEIETALDSGPLGKAAKAVGRVFVRKDGGAA